MDETRWIYVAMVAFLFLRWLINQFKVAAVKREELRQRRMRGFDEGAMARAEATNAPRMPPPLPAQHQSAPAQPVQRPAEGPQTLQELFQQLRQEIKRAQDVEKRPPETPSRPAPVPSTRQNQRNQPQASAKQKKRNQPKQAPVSEAPREPVPPPLVQSPIAADSHYQKSARKKSAITAILSDPEKTRHAVILREILGRPRGLNE